MMLPMDTNVLFDFNRETNPNKWQIVNDGVMGGLSQGTFQITEEGHGLFSGEISLENNGGFTSLRHRFDSLKVSHHKTVVLRLKGDGKTYKFRVKSNQKEQHSYTIVFHTTGNWQTIHLKFSDMVPKFRGRFLDLPPYPGQTLGEMAFLIANKKKESFQLEIDYIALR
ncbi:MAG: CIA30 family protein [Bacteroidota bacterium]